MRERRVKTFQCRWRKKKQKKKHTAWVAVGFTACTVVRFRSLWISLEQDMKLGSGVRRVTFQRDLSWQLKNLLTKRACRWRLNVGKHGSMKSKSVQIEGRMEENGGRMHEWMERYENADRESWWTRRKIGSELLFLIRQTLHCKLIIIHNSETYKLP